MSHEGRHVAFSNVLCLYVLFGFFCWVGHAQFALGLYSIWCVHKMMFWKAIEITKLHKTLANSKSVPPLSTFDLYSDMTHRIPGDYLEKSYEIGKSIRILLKAYEFSLAHDYTWNFHLLANLQTKLIFGLFDKFLSRRVLSQA